MADRVDHVISEVAWGSLHHAYGVAEDVPEQLRGLRSAVPEERGRARSQLCGNVCHQGTRWEASAYAVGPLVALIDDSGTPDRALVLDLLMAIVIGDRGDERLPFDAEAAFAAGMGMTGQQLRQVIEALYYQEEQIEDPELLALGDRAAVRWAGEAYHAATGYLPTYAGWLRDPDLAAGAAGLLAWFPQTSASLRALLEVPREPLPARASANLALAYVRDQEPGIDQRLEDLLTPDRDVVTVTAAIALAHRLGDKLPNVALTVLTEAEHLQLPTEFSGWNRAPRGFLARALHRLGLG